MNKSLQDIYDSTNSERKDSTVQNLKVEIESIKKSQTVRNLEIKTLGT